MNKKQINEALAWFEYIFGPLILLGIFIYIILDTKVFGG